MSDGVALEGEEQHDGEEQAVEGEQPDGDEQAGPGHLHVVEGRVEARGEPAEPDPERHRRGDPHRQEPVEDGQPARDRVLLGGLASRRGAGGFGWDNPAPLLVLLDRHGSIRY